MSKFFLSIALFFCMPFCSLGQLPLVKIELGAGYQTPLISGGDSYTQNGYLGENDYPMGVFVFLPTIHVPLSHHFDIGVGYHSAETKVDRRYVEPNTTDYNPNYYTYSIKEPVYSGFVTYNFSKSNRRVSPSLSYILSYTKGTASFPSSVIYYNSTTGVEETKTISTQEKDAQSKLQAELSNYETVHGLQAGVDIRLSALLSLSVKGRMYSFLSQNTNAFPTISSVNNNDRNRDKFTAVLAMVFKLSKGKKAEIK